MYEYFAFVDESTAKRYRLCLIAIPRKALAKTKEEIENLRLPGQRYIHMKNESDRRRKQILDVVLGIPSWRGLVAQSSHGRKIDVQTRQDLFILAASQPIWKEIRQLTVESSTDSARDAVTLKFIRDKISNRFSFRFCEPAEDSGLWIADIIVWAYAKGGIWRNAVLERVEVLTAP